MSEADWQAMDKEVLGSIEAAVAFAEKSPFPKPEQALEDMYAA
jgi:TPP-dependent pyruvate/acetoin dehydrogenase alpha subunit